jgi:serine/threonine protein kinase
VIGQGGFGTVLEGIVNKEEVIIKCVDKNVGEKEVFFLKKLSNVPGIVQYITHFSDKNYIYIVMQKLDNVVDLFKYINSQDKLPESTVQIIIKQLVNILSSCKRKGVLHNDIKDTNILINPTTLQITLIDFGAAQEWRDNSFYYKYQGTEFYSCPQWRSQKRYTANGMTSWSIGMLVFTMLFGEIQFDEILYFNGDKICSYETSHLSENAINFVTKCLINDLSERITLDGMLYHPWIKTTFEHQ